MGKNYSNFDNWWNNVVRNPMCNIKIVVLWKMFYYYKFISFNKYSIVQITTGGQMSRINGVTLDIYRPEYSIGEVMVKMSDINASFLIPHHEDHSEFSWQILCERLGFSVAKVNSWTSENHLWCTDGNRKRSSYRGMTVIYSQHLCIIVPSA
jgi:hypothetical protein